MDYAPEDGGNAEIFVQRELLLHVNRRPTDAMVAAGPYRAHLAILDVPGYGESASYGRHVARWVTGPTAFSRPGTSRYARCTRLWGISVLRTPCCLMGYRSHSFLTAGHISLYSMYPVMGNQRPTDAMLPDGLQVPQLSHGRAHLAMLDVPGYGESASYGRHVA